MIEKGLISLKNTSSFLVTHGSGEVKVDTYGCNFELVNAKPLYLRDDGTKDDTIVTFLGRVLKDGQEMTSNARTPYMSTPFVGVTKMFGASKYMPPSHPNDIKKAMKTLNKLTDPVQHYEFDVLQKAIEDYRTATLPLITNSDEVKSLLRMYTQEEAMNGTGDGVILGMPNSTSAGFPIMKSKFHCLERDPFDLSLPLIPRQFNDNFDIQSEIDRTLNDWSNGIRSEPIFKASSKVNELLPNKKAMDKVRKFYGSPFANFVASKMVLAGLPEFMCRFKNETECMVGINATSIEWQKFHDHVTKFGDDRMIAGDFAGFDTRMAAQITTAAASIIVSWYKAAGVSEEDLQLVRGCLSDIVNPNILFEGDLYRFANGNPSGNLITVQLNSICNSIMMRYCYYKINPNVKVPFNQNVALATYGDDNTMSVNKWCPWFTHTACRDVFATVDIEYTMADKETESKPYISKNEISFLKRKFRFEPNFGKIVAPIEEDSILKKFYYVKKPNESPLTFEEQFAAYCDGAFREAYLHGKVFYETFSSKIRTIVELNPTLKTFVCFISYGDMTKILKAYYRDDYCGNRMRVTAESDSYCYNDLE
jgi:hypothetical protein